MQAASPSSSLMLPAPAEAVSNPLFSGKKGTYGNTSSADGNGEKKKGDSPQDFDYILSSSQSSEEDD